MFGLLKTLSTRQVTQLDTTIKSLTDAVRDLYKEIHELRMAHVAMSKDIGALQEGQKSIKDRIDGQANAYRERFDALQMQINELSRGRPKK